jgi:tetratricopeptide (TPR) repeat protein
MDAVARQLRADADRLLELHEQGDPQALDACAALLAAASAADPTDPVVRETLFLARFERALLLTELGELEAAADAYAAAADSPADLDDPDQRHEVAMALLNQGICLDALGEHRRAVSAYDDLVVRFGRAPDPVTHDQVVRGRVNRAAALLALDELHEALTVAESLVDDLDSSEALEAEQLAMTMRIRAAALRALDRAAEAADALAAVERCAGADPATRTQFASAQRERAELLAELGRGGEAVAILEAAVERLAGDPDPDVLEARSELIDVEVTLLEQLGDADRADEVRRRPT